MTNNQPQCCSVQDDNTQLRAQVARMAACWMRHEHILPNGELGVDIGDVLAENERLQEENGVKILLSLSASRMVIERDDLKADNARLTTGLQQLGKLYADRAGDLAFEFARANEAEQDGQHWRERAETAEAKVVRLTELANAQAAADTAMLDKVEPILQQAQVLAKMRTAEVERLRRALTWHHCDTHSDIDPVAWGCPECVRELRLEVALLTGKLGGARYTVNALMRKLAQPTSAVPMAGPCSKLGGCDCGADTSEDTDTPGGHKEARSVTSHSRGHEIYHDGEFWRYQDTSEKVNDERPCKQCGLPPTDEGDDACMGHIPGATAACCGHGIADGYVRWFQKRETAGPTTADIRRMRDENEAWGGYTEDMGPEETDALQEDKRALYHIRHWGQVLR